MGLAAGSWNVTRRLQGWFVRCPGVAGTDDERRWRFLNASLAILTVLATIAGGSLFLFGQRWIGDVGLFTAAVYAALFGINRRGATGIVGRIFVGFMVLAVVVASLDSSRPVLFAVIVPLMYVIPITVAGVLLTWRGVLATLAATVVAVLWLYLSGMRQLEPLRREHFNAVAGMTTLIVIVVSAVGTFIAVFNRQLARERRALRHEREKSERLLLNVLPEPIAIRLKEEERPIAETYPGVTVLFADIVGFTEMSARLPPEQVVAWLDEVFSAFDELAGRLGLEKIKTIGDAYMAVAGLPHERGDHAIAAAEMALGMRKRIDALTTPLGGPLQMRIGMHSGPVVAGVIGRRKFIYDLWGDTVNTASRMESHGVPGAIQVSFVTRALLEGRYRFLERGPIAVKGKGEMDVYFLERFHDVRIG